MASAADSANTKDVRKVGSLKKLKAKNRVKKKYFVLRAESDHGEARLECFDAEKKFYAGHSPKDTIILKTCFNISKRSDAKHKFGIQLFARDEHFIIVCDLEVEQTEWLSALTELQLEARRRDAEHPLFEHIWHVKLAKKDLCGEDKKIMPGPYRLILTDKTLSLMRPTSVAPDVTFELEVIRSVHGAGTYVVVDLGRLAKCGEGKIWMDLEDEILAKNVHDVFNSQHLRKGEGGAEPLPAPFRQRARTVTDRPGSKALSIASSRTSVGQASFDSATLPKRSKTISEHSPRLRSGAKPRSSVLAHSPHSPLTTSPLSSSLQQEIRLRTDSMDSYGTQSSVSMDELDHLAANGSGSTRSTTPDGAPDQDYLAMAPTGSNRDLRVGGEEVPEDRSEYIEMAPTNGPIRNTTAPVSTPSSLPGASARVSIPAVEQVYMDMSPSTEGALAAAIHHGGSPYMDMSPDTSTGTGTDSGYTRDGGFYDSYSSSPAVSTSSGSGLTHEDDRTGYLDMAPLGHGLPTVKEQVRMNDGGYLDMTPGSSSPSGSLTQLRPDRAQGYIFDEDSTEPFPKRAYSVGSKPVKTKVPHEGYMDMSGRGAVLDKQSKSSSAPHLTEDELSSVDPALWPRGVGKDDFMELAFQPADRWRDAFRPRTGSGGVHDIRNRASSGGPADMMRPRTSSGGRVDMMRPRKSSAGQSDLRKRTSSFGRHGPQGGDALRPRTATIGSEAFRPRTSSFGTPAEMRPRSSSYGHQHQRYRKQRSLLQESLSGARLQSSRHSSQESLKRSGAGSTSRTSQESLKSSTSLEYMDMQQGSGVKLSSSPSQPGASFTGAYRKASSEMRRAGASPLTTGPTGGAPPGSGDENYMAFDFGDKPSSSSGVGSRRQSAGASSGGESRRRATLERLDKSAEKLSAASVSGSGNKATSATAATSTSSSTKSRLKQLGTKLNTKFHLKMPSSSSGGATGDQAESQNTTSGSRKPSQNTTQVPPSPGEYIDIDFEGKKQNEGSRKTSSSGVVASGNIPQVATGSREQKWSTTQSSSQNQSITQTRSPLVVEHDYAEIECEKDHYALMGHSDSDSSALRLSSRGTQSTSPKRSPRPIKSNTSPESLEAGGASPPVSSAQLISSMKGHVVPTGQHGTVGPVSHSNPGVLKSDSSAEAGGEGKVQKNSPSPKASNKQKVTSKVEQSSAGSSGSSGRKLSSSPLASFLHGLSQAGRKSPKHGRSSGSPSPKVMDEVTEGAYSEMSFAAASTSPQSPGRRSESTSPNPPSQFTKTPPLSIPTVKPSTATLPSASRATAAFRRSTSVTAGPDKVPNSSTSASATASSMRGNRSAGNLTTLDPSQTPSSNIHVTSPKILLTSSELISELSSAEIKKTSAKSGSGQVSEYANMSFDKKPSRQSSHSSAGSCDPELHYAALDLSTSTEDMPPASDLAGGRSPGGKSRHGSGGSAVVGAEDNVPLQYAQIDFVKSEALKSQQSPGAKGDTSKIEEVPKETPPPFDVGHLAPTGVIATQESAKRTEEPFDLA